MTFDLGSSDEKFEFGGCDEIERMRNGRCGLYECEVGNECLCACVSSTQVCLLQCALSVHTLCTVRVGWLVCTHLHMNDFEEDCECDCYTYHSVCPHSLAEMKAKLDNHEGNGEALRASSSTEKSPAANEEPSATEEDMAPQFIESWEELDEDDVLEGDGAVGQSGGSGSAAVGIDGISGAVDERNGMGLTDDVLTQLLGFHLDDPEEDALVRMHLALSCCQ